MSYILDALRKAERDRNLGKTPTLGDAATPPARAAAPSAITTRTLALFALVVGLLILAVLLWPRAPVPDLPPAVQVLAPAAEPAPAPVVAPQPEPAPEPIATGEPALDEDVVAETLDDLLEPAEEEVGVADEDEEAIGDSVPPAPRSVADPAPVAVAEPIPASGATLLRDMPADYRGAFPAIRVDVHVYNDDPARRWVMINGNKAVEGATLAEGPSVAEITPEGIVFDFRGRTAMFPLKR